MAHCEVSSEGVEGGLRKIAFVVRRPTAKTVRLTARSVNGGNADFPGSWYDSNDGL
jgi:hypothetical protein